MQDRSCGHDHYRRYRSLCARRLRVVPSHCKYEYSNRTPNIIKYYNTNVNGPEEGTSISSSMKSFAKILSHLPNLPTQTPPMEDDDNRGGRVIASADNEDFKMSSHDYFGTSNIAAAPLKKLQISAANLKIQVCSDLHTEFYGCFENIPDDIIVPKAPVLALLGDIGLAKTESLEKFLLLQATRFEHVLFVAGNHEYYNARHTSFTVSDQFRWLHEVCSQKDNLHFLERAAIEINDIIILGTTLWSKIPKQNMDGAQMSMNDYRVSYQRPSKAMTVKCTNYQFDASIKWLEEQIHTHGSKNKSIIVLTHHTPLLQGTSNPMYDGGDLTCCFSTNLSRLLQKPIKYWACGHTHWNFDHEFDNGNTRLVSNQRGYPGKRHVGYDNEGLILNNL